MHLSVALDGAGWHPAAWREPRARPAELFTARYWTDVIAKAIATLDYASNGRAGVRVRVSASPDEAAHFGRRVFPRLSPADRDDPAVHQLKSELFDEAADYIEVVRRLWDSWEDDAEIRDVASGRFIDRGKRPRPTG